MCSSLFGGQANMPDPVTPPPVPEPPPPPEPTAEAPEVEERSPAQRARGTAALRIPLAQSAPTTGVNVPR